MQTKAQAIHDRAQKRYQREIAKDPHLVDRMRRETDEVLARACAWFDANPNPQAELATLRRIEEIDRQAMRAAWRPTRDGSAGVATIVVASQERSAPRKREQSRPRTAGTRAGPGDDDPPRPRPSALKRAARLPDVVGEDLVESYAGGEPPSVTAKRYGKSHVAIIRAVKRREPGLIGLAEVREKRQEWLEKRREWSE